MKSHGSSPARSRSCDEHRELVGRLGPQQLETRSATRASDRPSAPIQGTTAPATTGVGHAHTLAVMTAADDHARRAVEAVWRGESARIVSALTRHTGDFAWAEDLAQEALLEALAGWPRTGIPDNPGAWLLAVAKRRAIDGWRRRERLAGREPLLAVDVRDRRAARRRRRARRPRPHRRRRAAARLRRVSPDPSRAGTPGPDAAHRRRAHHRADRPRAAHDGAHGAAAHRARQADARRRRGAVRGAGPRERPGRLASVLQVIYLLFTEGYAAAGGDAAGATGRRARGGPPGPPAAGAHALRARGAALIALMEFQSSRFAARVDRDGLPLTLGEQDRRRWDRSAIDRGRASLAIERMPRAGVSATTACRPRSPSATPSRRRSTRPTGADRRAVRRAPGSSLPRPWCASIAPSPCRWAATLRRRWRSSTASRQNWRTSARCMPCVPSCWSVSESRMPQPRRSGSQRRCRETTQRRRCCCASRAMRSPPRPG